MLSVMKTQKTESHKDDRNRGHCTCSNGKVESQCEWQAGRMEDVTAEHAGKGLHTREA